MDNRRELDDVCAGFGIRAYQKSLLYLVSRALERSTEGGEVPLLGMEKFLSTEVGRGETLHAAVAAAGGELIFSPSDSPPESRTDAASHGAFDDDTETMTSVAMRILQSERVEIYKANAPLRPNSPGPAPQVAPERVGEVAIKAAFAKPVGALPVAVSAEPGADFGESAPIQADGSVLEVAAAPKSGSPVLDVMESCGWKTGAPSANGSRWTGGQSVASGGKQKPKIAKGSARRSAKRRR
jgi:hypothetical protein